MATTIKLSPLLHQEQAAFNGFTHYLRLSSNDLTETATATSQTFQTSATVFPIGSYGQVDLRLETAFADASDSAFNDVKISIGDDNSATALLAATQVNVNGTEVLNSLGTLETSVYTTARKFVVTVASMTGKALNDIDTGTAFILVKIVNPAVLADLKGNVASTK